MCSYIHPHLSGRVCTAFTKVGASCAPRITPLPPPLHRRLNAFQMNPSGKRGIINDFPKFPPSISLVLQSVFTGCVKPDPATRLTFPNLLGLLDTMRSHVSTRCSCSPPIACQLLLRMCATSYVPLRYSRIGCQRDVMSLHSLILSPHCAGTIYTIKRQCCHHCAACKCCYRPSCRCC